MKLLLAILTFMFVQTALADDTQASLGGTLTDTSSLYTGSFSYAKWDKDNTPWGHYIDADFFYQDSKNVITRNEVNVFGKINYNLNDQNYLQTALRYEYNQFAPYTNKVVIGAGHGYRFIHTDTVKISAETSIGLAEADNLNQVVFRESIWASYKFAPKSTVSNKFLIETGGPIDYKRNVLAVNYDLSDTVVLSVANTIVRDWRNTDTTTFLIGVHF